MVCPYMHASLTNVVASENDIVAVTDSGSRHVSHRRWLRDSRLSGLMERRWGWGARTEDLSTIAGLDGLHAAVPGPCPVALWWMD